VNSTQEQWELIDGLYHCHRHNGEPFERGDVCHACASDPGPRIDVQASAIEDVEARAVEAEVRQVAKTAKRTADELLAGDNKLERVTSVKFYELHIKATRLWHELHAKRMQIESDERLVEHDRKALGIRGSN